MTRGDRQEQLAAYQDIEATLEQIRNQRGQMEDAPTDNDGIDSPFKELVDMSTTPQAQTNVARDLPAELTIPSSSCHCGCGAEKLQLYLPAVELFAKRPPLYCGRCIGTTLSAHILAAISRNDRIEEVKKLLGSVFGSFTNGARW
ncbi:hypothetical protein VP01_2969g3 [Puccinia sorghi]|uniref:Uncharacterized protein n=1 Tax=Puccinia sorghi TaxID=27349 RepID=A0A0L6V0T1_9BASI|nr:hypothetical protein VP01_2969g3 [Puccinia sorghi]